MPGTWDLFATFPLIDDFCMSHDELLFIHGFDDPRGGATECHSLPGAECFSNVAVLHQTSGVFHSNLLF